MTAMDRVLDACRAKCGEPKKQGRAYRFAHPCHPEGDEARSFSVQETADGTVLIKSHKPSYTEEDCLNVLGVKWSELFPKVDKRGEKHMGDGSRAVYAYEYVGAMGDPTARVIRYETKNNGKKFTQFRYEGEKAVPGLNKPDGDKVVLPLYLLPFVQQAIEHGNPVYLNEGEEDARACMRQGICGTTKAGGAGSAWHPEVLEQLRGADVVIIADKDEPGYKAASTAYLLLEGIAKSRRIVEAKEGKDARDHFEQYGHGVADFVDRSDLHPKKATLSTTCLNGVFNPVEMQYLVEPYLPLGKAVLLDADGGTGKTTFCLAIAAGLSQGQLPNGLGSCPPAKTLYLMGDNDTPEELETVYRANGGREKHLITHCGAFPLDNEHLQLIENTIEEHGVKFLVLDPFLYFLNGLVRDINDSVQVLPYCQALGKMIERAKVACIAVRHVPKSAMAQGGTFGGLGSVQFRNSFRGNLHMRKHPEERGVVMVHDDKGSLLNPTGEPMAFRRVGLEVQFLSDWVDPLNQGIRTCSKDKTEAWLKEHVPCEWTPTANIDARAKAEGFAINGTFLRARKALCEGAKINGVWHTRLIDPFNEDMPQTHYWQKEVS